MSSPTGWWWFLTTWFSKVRLWNFRTPDATRRRKDLNHCIDNHCQTDFVILYLIIEFFEVCRPCSEPHQDWLKAHKRFPTGRFCLPWWSLNWKPVKVVRNLLICKHFSSLWDANLGILYYGLESLILSFMTSICFCLYFGCIKCSDFQFGNLSLGFYLKIEYTIFWDSLCIFRDEIVKNNSRTHRNYMKLSSSGWICTHLDDILYFPPHVASQLQRL